MTREQATHRQTPLLCTPSLDMKCIGCLLRLHVRPVSGDSFYSALTLRYSQLLMTTGLRELRGIIFSDHVAVSCCGYVCHRYLLALYVYHPNISTYLSSTLQGAVSWFLVVFINHKSTINRNIINH